MQTKVKHRVHAWLHSCIYDTLYHCRRNDRDREDECDSGIIFVNLFIIKYECITDQEMADGSLGSAIRRLPVAIPSGR